MAEVLSSAEVDALLQAVSIGSGADMVLGTEGESEDIAFEEDSRYNEFCLEDKNGLYIVFNKIHVGQDKGKMQVLKYNNDELENYKLISMDSARKWWKQLKDKGYVRKY